MITPVGKGEGYGLEITGMSHTLKAMHVDGERWIGLLHIDSPTDGALLEPQDALALRDWLNQRLLNMVDTSRAEHDDFDCATAQQDGYLMGLCRDCYVKHTGLRP